MQNFLIFLMKWLVKDANKGCHFCDIKMQSFKAIQWKWTFLVLTFTILLSLFWTYLFCVSRFWQKIERRWKCICLWALFYFKWLSNETVVGWWFVNVCCLAITICWLLLGWRGMVNYLFVVVQKFNMVVTPIITRAGTALTSSQKLINELVTRTIPGTKTVVK